MDILSAHVHLSATSCQVSNTVDSHRSTSPAVNCACEGPRVHAPYKNRPETIPHPWSVEKFVFHWASPWFQRLEDCYSNPSSPRLLPHCTLAQPLVPFTGRCFVAKSQLTLHFISKWSPWVWSLIFSDQLPSSWPPSWNSKIRISSCDYPVPNSPTVAWLLLYFLLCDFHLSFWNLFSEFRVWLKWLLV